MNQPCGAQDFATHYVVNATYTQRCFSVTTTTTMWRREPFLPLLPLLCSWSFTSLSGDDFKSPRLLLCHECFMINFFFMNCVEQRQRVKSMTLHTKNGNRGSCLVHKSQTSMVQHAGLVSVHSLVLFLQATFSVGAS